MPITPKPKSRAAATEAGTQAFIDRGMSIQGTVAATAPADVTTTVRIPGRIAGPMKAAIDARAVPITQNTWILEAIAEKLAREQG